MIPEILFLVEQICPRTTQIYDLGAAISVLFQAGAFEAVEGVGDTLMICVSDVTREKRTRRCSYLATADKTLVLVVAKGAFIADADEGCGADVTVAYGALAVALVAETTDGDASRLPAHYQITAGWSAGASLDLLSTRHLRMMARHDGDAGMSVRCVLKSPDESRTVGSVAKSARGRGVACSWILRGLWKLSKLPCGKRD